MNIAINKVSSSYKVSIFYLILLFIVIGAGWFTTRYLGDKARQEILQSNESAILTHSSTFTVAFEHIVREARVLSGSPLIAPALISRKDEDIANANSALDRYNSGLGSSVSYLMDSNGMTIASSNRNDPDSFVGKSYQFRPYFIQAMKNAPGRYFALGSTSLKRGFYASYPVKDSNGQIIGVVVIKKDIDGKETHLSRYPYFFLVDPNGIIFVSNKKDMTLKSLWPISRETKLALRESGQFGEREFDAVLPQEIVDGMEIRFDGRNYLASRKVINPEGWSAVIMTPTERVLQYKLVGVIISMWLCTLIAVPMIINYRTSKSAEMMRASETRYRELVDNTSSAVAIYEVKDDGKDFILKDFNKAGERIDGARKEDIIGKSIHEVRSGIREAGLVDVFERVWKTGIPEHHAASFYHDQKIASWYENFVYKLPTGEIVAVYDDITDRMRAEEALRLSERRLRRAEVVSRFGNWEFILGAGKVKASEGARIIYGVEGSEWSIPEVKEIPLPEYRDMLDKALKGLIDEGKPYNVEFKIRRPADGKIIDIHSIAEYSSEKGVVFGVMQDITERKRAEEELRESEELYRTLVSLSPDAISVADPNGLLVLTSPKARQVFGDSPDDDILGRSVLSWIAPEEQEKASANIRHLLAEGTLTTSEYTLLKKDGTCFIGEVNAAVIHSPDGSPMKVIIITRDITERKKAEEERRKLEARLQRAEKMEALGTLAGGVAHDLNNVLGIVVGYSELLVYDSGESGSAKSKAMEILKGGQRAAAIVQDLLTLARRGVSNRKAVNLNNIVLECRKSPEFAGVSAYHPDMRLQTDLEPHLLNISGSAVHLSKSIMNLVSNAAEAMPQGGVVTIKTWNQYLDRPISGYDEVQEGDYVVLSVSDTGEGIPAGDLKRIFEPFYTKKIMGRSGTGLGLAVIWGTVKDHSGYINVESEEGNGSIFTLYFPVTREELSREQVPVSTAEYMGTGEFVLVVDDVKEQRELAGTMLEKLNYNVVSVSSGEEAVEYLRQNAVDLVVLDMIMDPGMDGFDTYAKIIEIHPHQRAIIVSGFSETERVSKAQALGAGTYVKKPYVLERLGLAVRKELDRPSGRQK